MSFQGINFSSQHIVPSDDGRLYEAIFEDGALHGCELSYVGAALTIGAGYLMIGGREIEITADEVFNINEATSGYAQLVLTIDLTQTATIGAFNQVSIDVRYASTEAGFASLIQDDINGAGTKYQQQLALVSLGTGGITGIVAGMPSASLKGAGRVFSIIAVTYPAGSTCTCSDGTTTLTARDTSGTALFNVPSAGTWTVTARTEDGSKEKSIDVTITAAGQVENVTILYITYLYNHGDECTDLTGGWIFYGTADGTIKNNGSNIVVDITGISGSQSYAAYRTANKIDLSTLKTLNIKVDEYSGNEQWFYLCVNTEYQTSENFFADGYAARVKLNDNGVFSIDVSNLYDSYYIWLSCNHNGPASVYYTKSKISEIWGN